MAPSGVGELSKLMSEEEIKPTQASSRLVLIFKGCGLSLERGGWGEVAA